MSMNIPRRQPLYQQIKSLLTRRIINGEWRAHDALPSEWALADELAVSQGTVRKALEELESEGVLYRQQGRGTFIAEVVSDWGENPLLTAGLLNEHPDKLVPELLSCSRTNASEVIAERLNLRRSEPVILVRQLWRQRGQIVAVDNAYLSAERFDGLDTRYLRESGGVYAALQRHFSVRPKVLVEQLQAVDLEREEARLLQVVPPKNALLILRLSGNIAAEPVEWRQRFCLTDRQAYTVSRNSHT